MKLAFLQHAQQLGLRIGVQVADLVEKERPAVGQLEFAAPHRRGAGERAFLVAEQFAFNQLTRNGGTVHLDERAFDKRTLLMDISREQLLARARFTDQQHAGIGARGRPRVLLRINPDYGYVIGIDISKTRSASSCST